MNRIRKFNNKYQVIITPHISISPDSSILLGNWMDINFRDCYVLEYPSLQDALAEALNYPDIDWYRIVMNHKYVFERIKNTLKDISSNYPVQFIPKLMSPTGFKNKIFDKVIHFSGTKNRLAGGFFNEIITITIVHPYNDVLNEISKSIMTYTDHLWSDSLRIIDKINKENEIIIIGKTELGTTYTIRLITNMFHQFKMWYSMIGHKMDESIVDKKYNTMKKQQEFIDSNSYSFE